MAQPIEGSGESGGRAENAVGARGDGLPCIGIVMIINSQPEVSMSHSQFANCIEACNACADACDHCATACLGEPDPKPMARCIALDMDCAAICRLAASYTARGSEHAAAICALCADVCESCGKECGKHDMDHCQKCAQACRRCAEECRLMAGKKSSAVSKPGQKQRAR